MNNVTQHPFSQPLDRREISPEALSSPLTSVHFRHGWNPMLTDDPAQLQLHLNTVYLQGLHQVALSSMDDLRDSSGQIWRNLRQRRSYLFHEQRNASSSISILDTTIPPWETPYTAAVLAKVDDATDSSATALTPSRPKAPAHPLSADRADRMMTLEGFELSMKQAYIPIDFPVPITPLDMPLHIPFGSVASQGHYTLNCFPTGIAPLTQDFTTSLFAPVQGTIASCSSQYSSSVIPLSPSPSLSPPIDLSSQLFSSSSPIPERISARASHQTIAQRMERYMRFKSSHPDPSTGKFFCLGCPIGQEYQFKENSQLQRHANRHNFTALNRRYRCCHCERGFDRMDALTRHMRASAFEKCKALGLYSEYDIERRVVKLRERVFGKKD